MKRLLPTLAIAGAALAFGACAPTTGAPPQTCSAHWDGNGTLTTAGCTADPTTTVPMVHVPEQDNPTVVANMETPPYPTVPSTTPIPTSAPAVPHALNQQMGGHEGLPVTGADIAGLVAVGGALTIGGYAMRKAAQR